MKLTHEICSHILTNIGCLEKPSHSLFSESFQTNKSISYIDGSSKKKVTIYGATLHHDISLNFLTAQLSNPKEIYCIIYADKLPFYGIHYLEDESRLTFSADGSGWLDATVYLQATLLASLELLGERMTLAEALTDVESGYKAMLSFIEWIAQGDE